MRILSAPLLIGAVFCLAAGGVAQPPGGKGGKKDGPPVEDLKPRKPIEVATGHPTSVYRMVLSPDGKESVERAAFLSAARSFGRSTPT
jgi:hypothetical protein